MKRNTGVSGWVTASQWNVIVSSVVMGAEIIFRLEKTTCGGFRGQATRWVAGEFYITLMRRRVCLLR